MVANVHMAENQQVITRIDNKVMFSLMFSFLMLVIAMQATLYVWNSAIIVLLILWRFLFQQKRTSLPTLAVLNLLAILCALLVFYFSLSAGLLNAMTNLLLLGTTLKLLSLNKTREIKPLCASLYFTIASAFIFKQDIGYAVFVFAIGVINTYTLMMVHSPGMTFIRRAQFALRFFLISVPLVIFLFVLAPRLGPLWKMPTAVGQSSGLSEQISPGDFSNLAQSSELAFRAVFDHAIPENKDLYWRTMVHESFDGKTWSVHRLRKAPQNIVSQRTQPLPSTTSKAYHYQVIAEPTYDLWLYALDTPFTHSAAVEYQADRRLTSKQPITQKFQYEVTSILNHPEQQLSTTLEQQINLSQPTNQNQRSQAFARDLRRQSSSDLEYINKVLDYLVDNHFIYTLQPPPLPIDPVDTFLFETRAGFCAHYASAFAVLMRSAGIPARIVSGYQGGERADNGQYLSVYQYEAHAWVEVWLDQIGWLRVDPTATVSPDRIRLGLQGAVQDQSTFLSNELFNLVKYKQFAALNWLRNQLNNVDFYWSSWVLNFDDKKQSNLLESLWGKHNSITYGLYSGLVFLGFIAFIYLLSRSRALKHRPSPMLLAHQKLIKLASLYHFHRPASVPPLTYLDQFAQQQPQLRPELSQLSAIYQHCLYQKLTDQQLANQLGQLQLMIKKLTHSAPNRYRRWFNVT